MALEFEWDSAKAERNLKEHGVSFDEATTVFRDTLSITIADPDHSDSENPLSTLACLILGNCSWYRTQSAEIRFELSVLGERHELNGRTMKKQSKRKSSEDKDSMRPEYDFSKGVRGKHAARYAEGTN